MQPQPPNTRQSGPESKPAPRNAREAMKPGGPIMPKKQGFRNPGATPNLRGVEPNTSMHKGTPNPEQKGTAPRLGDHNPPMNDDVHGHGITPGPIPNKGRKMYHSKPTPTPMPGDAKHYG